MRDIESDRTGTKNTAETPPPPILALQPSASPLSDTVRVSVIPAEAGIQSARRSAPPLDARLRGHDESGTVESRTISSEPGNPEAVQAIITDLQRAAALMRNLSATHLAEFDLNPVRHGVLEILADRDDGCSQAELAQRLQQSESGVSTLVDRMRGSGLLYRLRSKSDRRKRLLMIAPRGRELLALCRQRHLGRMATFFAGFDSRALHELAGLLDRLVRSISAAARLESGKDASNGSRLIEQPTNAGESGIETRPIDVVATFPRNEGAVEVDDAVDSPEPRRFAA
ncbi:MAG: MarR family winged helix-turn-helix transcriptional regulator [Planctomycetaceae bacterium]